MVKKLGLKLKDQKGFTLIELLAVIVILGILAAIAIPTISRVIDNSKASARINEAIQIIDAAKLAHAEGVKVVTGTVDVATNGDITWTHTEATTTPTVTAAKNPLGTYISKLKDKDFIVKYDATAKKYTIQKHESAPDVSKALEKTTAYDESTLVEEEELAQAAR